MQQNGSLLPLGKISKHLWRAVTEGISLCWTCRNCQAEHLESLLKQSENLHFSPAIHILILQSAFTHISLNWTLIKLGHLDCQTIAPQDLTTPNKAAAKGALGPSWQESGSSLKSPPKAAAVPAVNKQEKKLPFSAPTEFQMGQKDNWEEKDLVISHQHYLFQFCLHHSLKKPCSGEAATSRAQESSSTWAGVSTRSSRTSRRC